MENIKQVASRFHALFAGLDRVYGQFTPGGEVDERGKVPGIVVTKRERVTLDLWHHHLTGKTGLGIVPIRDDCTCVFGAIDIDEYAGLDHATVAATVERLSLPLIVCRSKSGGCHLYLFSSGPVNAALLRRKLQSMAARLGYGQSEIFPKQSKIQPSENGSWLNICCFGGDTGTRYAVRPDGVPMTVLEFLDAAESIKVQAEFFNAAKPGVNGADDALPGGPPCLNHLISIGMPEGGRNKFLSNVARYAKRANPSGWQADVEKYNRGCCTPPVDHAEMGLILNSAAKKDYSYSCSDPLLAAHCSRSQCRLRKFGVGNEGEYVPEFGTLTKFASAPPVRWIYEVDGVRLPLSTEQLIDHRLFRKACVEHLTKIPGKLKAEDWEKHLKQAFETVHIEQLDEDASAEGQFWHLLEKFCTGQAQAPQMDEIMMGKPHTAEDGRTYFRIMDLNSFLVRYHFRELSLQRIAAILKERGGNCKQIRLKRNGPQRVWDVPAFPTQTEGHDVPESILADPSAF